MFPIASDVPVQLWFPILSPAPWTRGSRASFVLVPETPVDEDGHMTTWENEIRFTGKASNVQAITQAKRVEKTADSPLRPGVFRSNSAHRAAALFGDIDHCRNSTFRLGSVSTSSMISL